MDSSRDLLRTSLAPRDSPPAATVIVIRYAVSLPDLTLAIARPYEVLVAALKRTIRTQLPDEYRERDLKLICAGRVLLDTSTVSAALRLQPPRSSLHLLAKAIPSVEGAQVQYRQDAQNSKGKERELPGYSSEDDRQQPVIGVSIIMGQTNIAEFLRQTQPTYVHCAVTGTSLSPQSLAAELSLSSTPLDLESQVGSTGSALHPSEGNSLYSGGNTLPLSPPLLGFDRLLHRDSSGSDQDNPASTLVPNTAGSYETNEQGDFVVPNHGSSNSFSRADIANLRAQFRALVAARHTPETMPDTSTLLQLEERWLDSGVGPTIPTNTTGTAAPATGPLDEEDTLSAALDDMFLGVVTGFFWPIGALVWGLRETGVWSWRRQISVIAGVLVNLSFGILRFLA